MLALEAMTHTLYFNGIAQQRMWNRWPASSDQSFSASDIGIAGFWVLNFMWLKVRRLLFFFPLAITDPSFKQLYYSLF